MSNFIFAISTVILGVALAAVLVIFTKRATRVKTNFSDTDLIKIWSKRMKFVCIIALVFAVIGTLFSVTGLAQKANEKTFTTENGITMNLQETYDENGQKTYVGKYINDEGQEFTYYVSEPNNDTSSVWEALLQTVIGLIVLIFVLCIGIDILNRILKDGTPFTETVSNKLLLIGTVLLTSGIIKQTVVAVIMLLSGLWKTDSDITIILIDFAQTLTGLLIYLISVIFKYGSRLQRTEDELI